jgi:hypothetical protein
LVAGIVEPSRNSGKPSTGDHPCRDTLLTDELADRAILEMYRQGFINVTRIADVVR